MNISRKLSLFILTGTLLALPFYSVTSGQRVAPDSFGGNEVSPYFSDVPTNHPFAATVDSSKEHGYVAGNPDGTFAPDNSVNRAEFITMVVASLTDNPRGSNCFSDVQDQWYAKFVCYAKENGLVAGYPDGSYGPANNINIAEASAILSQAYNLRPGRDSRIWYKPYLERLEQKSAIPTTIDYPDKKLSRAETAEIVYRLGTGTTDRPTKTYEALIAPLPAIGSCVELEEKLKVAQYKQAKGTYARGGIMLMDTAVSAMTEGEAESAAPPAAPTAEPSADDYSSTNVQVEGVDEADIIKNDGEYVYILNSRTLRIVKAYPVEEMQEVSRFVAESDTDFYPSGLYITENRVIITGSTNGVENGDYRSRTKIFVLDTTDKANPTVARTVEFDGNEVSTRRIGNRIYIVTNQRPNLYRILEPGQPMDETTLVPQMRDSAVGEELMSVAPCTDIRFIPNYEETNFLTVASFDIDDGNSSVAKEVVMGGGQSIYSSVENLYVAAQQYIYPRVGVVDLWAPQSFEEKTSVYRFSLNNGEVKFETKGDVPGHLLNQFSMDENGEAFRVATTVGEVWNASNLSTNNLYILDRNNLGTTLGKIEGIAPGEKIYSVRFLGGRAYMVTFKKIDPFFVIDVSEPTNPRILGELKIPGYSDYLHPFDENHIIGFGKEAVDPQELEDADRNFFINRGFSFAWYQGMKIALFDVTDPANPVIQFKVDIGDRGTESELLRNHKALLYDKARNLFAFPVTVAEIENKEGEYTGSQYGNEVFQGAYVYTLDLQNGFTLQGTITHHEDPAAFENPNYGWQSMNSDINRIVYMGDYLYTVSNDKVKATLRDGMQEAGALLLPPVPTPLIQPGS